MTLVAKAVIEMTSSTKEIAHNAEQTAETVHSSSVQIENDRNLVINSRTSINNLAQELI